MKSAIQIINKEKQDKLINRFSKYLKSKKKSLTQQYGLDKAERIISETNQVYPEIVKVLPTFHTPMYDNLMVSAAKMAALKKGMKSVDIVTDEFVKFNIEETRSIANKIPKLLRKLMGRIYLSRLMRKHLIGVATRVSENGWPTKLINGSKGDDFAMSIETRNCQMVKFWESIGEGDIKPYCTFFDFTSAEILGIGLKQVSDIDSGVCKYCFYKNGNVEWPDRIKELLQKNGYN